MVRSGPMLLISGAADSTTAGMGHFQDLDQVSLARPVTKLSRSIDSAARTLQILNEALDMAVADPRGPAHLMFPMDVQRSEAGDGAGAPPPLKPLPVPADLNVQEVARALATAKAPLAIAGSSMFYEGAGAEMRAFCEDCRIPVVTPIWDRGSFDRPSRVFLGTIGAASGGPSILGEADCILLAGAEIDYRIGYLLPPDVRSDARVLPFRKSWDALATACFRQDNQRAGRMAGRMHRRRNEFLRGIRKRAEEQSAGACTRSTSSSHRERAHGKSGSVDRRRQHRAVGAPVAVYRSLPRRLADVRTERRRRLGHRGRDGGAAGVSAASRDPVIG